MFLSVESDDHQRFAREVRRHFDPFTARSGTFWVARLLRDLIVSQRAQVAVEFGAGYTSLFIARALQEADALFVDEKAKLIRKCIALLERLRASGERIDSAHPLSPRLTLLIYDFLDKGGETSCLDPAYYLAPFGPRLYCFEAAPEGSPYVQRLRSACADLDLTSYLEIYPSATIAGFAEKLGAIARPVDLFWFDSGPYRELFSHSWHRLRAGGTTVFHRGLASLRAEIDWILESRRSQNDISLYEMIEPNKLIQNGAYILQKRNFESFGETRPSQPSAMAILQSIDHFVCAEIADARSIFDQNN